ncbi:acyl-CoA dehydrogenase family protein [Embleya sp. NPDC020886]|uniref:acyl-CoA dehydrogenase family protein n=1 Tax=Embleya sp. NPDC020886 TaxID=3363980 RepID=UPI0037A4FD00
MRPQDVLDRVEALLPALRERAQVTEDARRVPTASVAELRAAGFFDLLQPKRFGGMEADPIHHFTAVRAIASACGSTGWVASVLGAHQWHLAQFDPRAQDDVWGADRTTVLSSAYAPPGRATETEGAISSTAGGASPRGWTTRVARSWAA